MHCQERKCASSKKIVLLLTTTIATKTQKQQWEVPFLFVALLFATGESNVISIVLKKNIV